MFYVSTEHLNTSERSTTGAHNVLNEDSVTSLVAPASRRIAGRDILSPGVARKTDKRPGPGDTRPLLIGETDSQ
jgi:hypothetical protein